MIPTLEREARHDLNPVPIPSLGSHAARQGQVAGPDVYRTTEVRSIKFTRREMETMILIALGMSSSEAADEPSLSKRKIDSHFNNVFRKCRVRDRVQAIRAARAIGALPFEPQPERGRQDHISVHDTIHSFTGSSAFAAAPDTEASVDNVTNSQASRHR
jgi:DNA-binding CsgD family transcriptional regulator